MTRTISITKETTNTSDGVQFERYITQDFGFNQFVNIHNNTHLIHTDSNGNMTITYDASRAIMSLNEKGYIILHILG